MGYKGMLRYTAKRSLVPGHTSGSPYTVPVDFEDATVSAQAVRSREQSDGGQTETVLDRVERVWQITLAPTAGFTLRQLREFMDSTEGGELFRCWPFGDEAAALILKRVDDGHTETTFIRAGARASDAAALTFNALQTVESDQGESIDIYDPNLFLDAANPAGPLDPPFCWVVDAIPEYYSTSALEAYSMVVAWQNSQQDPSGISYSICSAPYVVQYDEVNAVGYCTRTVYAGAAAPTLCVDYPNICVPTSPELPYSLTKQPYACP